MPVDDLETLLRGGGPVGTVAVDVSTGAMQPPAQAEGRRREVTEALQAAGAGDDVVAALLGVVAQVPGAADPIGAVAASDGATTVSLAAPGAAPASTVAEFGSVPDLTALLRARERAVPVLVVEARSDGGTVRLFEAPGLAESQQQDAHGDETAVHQAHAGGVAQSAHAGSAEDALAKNAAALADSAAVAARESGVTAILVTGDPRAAELFTQQLPGLDGIAVAALGKDTSAAGADPDDLTGAVRATAESLLADTHRSLVDRLSADSFRLGAVGVEDVVAALQGAAVDVLLLGPEGLEGELVALDAAPWIALTEDDALGAGVVGRVPAAAAIVRAAVLTAAPVRFPGPGVLPGPVAAHLRRPADV